MKASTSSAHPRNIRARRRDDGIDSLDSTQSETASQSRKDGGAPLVRLIQRASTSQLMPIATPGTNV
ncbi:hypothetical protein V5O48_008214 [Marasmius crinis-equi]|uniref:Uncharacterized protein n=1 Tax=Marasmius crinis-equi TaxID=585013 RepID=A0ABR3FEZ3_9AGAR